MVPGTQDSGAGFAAKVIVDPLSVPVRYASCHALPLKYAA
jgi:hypothetical protein